MFAVLDTCVLVSALRSSSGASHAVLQAVYARRIRIALSVSLAMEYEAVCSRPGLVPALTAGQIRTVVDVLCALAHQQKVFFTWRPHLPDADDDHVFELAVAAGAPYIITQNFRDFRGSDSLGVQTITPARALTLI
ncbi:MAG TPA: putative toxin-antitoxin system toxin component, PIN family [Prosthecobacter sp.]|nr:putative toxin-antitoxin system toxin component, PIN family [Prosthecobacter sp.]HRK15297.1 putative toxin-antitoxin system toxin component, PIN family [Prosthecobacter sp.]